METYWIGEIAKPGAEWWPEHSLGLRVGTDARKRRPDGELTPHWP